MGEEEGLMGAMRGKVPDAGVGRGEAGEADESDESETDSERRRPSMGMGSECGTFFSLEGMENNILDWSTTEMKGERV